MEYIRIEDLTKKIKGKIILNSVNLEIQKNTVTLIVGENGSGKTMLLRSIAGLIRPSEGSIWIDNKPMIFNEAYPVSLGICIDQTGMQYNQTGYENLRFLADINKKIGDEEIYSYMKTFDIYKAKDIKYKKYSLGMKKKLSIIQAIMEDQELILFDEPMNGLDKNTMKVFRDVIERLKNEGKTIIIVTHKPQLFTDITDNIFEIYEGNLSVADEV